MQRALKGEPFTYEGRYLNFDRPITIRPHLDPARQINFSGAIGSLGLAKIMADLELKPLSLS